MRGCTELGKDRDLLTGAWEGWPRPRMKAQVAFSAPGFPTEDSGSCSETAASRNVCGIPGVKIGRLALRFLNCECVKILRRNPKLDVNKDEIN